MYIYQYKGDTKSILDMVLQTTLIKTIMTPKFALGFMLVSMTDLPDLVQKYLFSDYTFLTYLAIAMILDLATGVNKVWINQGFSFISSKGMRDTVSKCIQYGAFLIITHILTHFEINGQVAFDNMDWLSKLAYEFIIFIEIYSVYENIRDTNGSKLAFLSLLAEKGRGLLDLFSKKKDDTHTEE